MKKEPGYLNPIVTKKKMRYDYIYSLNGDNGVHQVCMSFFTKLFQVNRNRIRNAIAYAVSNPGGYDHRGKFPKKMVSTADNEFIQDFIRQFQTYESRFKSQEENEMFLHPQLNLFKLYKQYKTICAFQNRRILSRKYFVAAFKSGFSIDFPKKRLNKKCLKCCAIDRKMLRPLSTLWGSYVEVLTFELCMPFDLPSIFENNVIMQSRQLWQFNMFIHDCKARRCAE